MSKLRYPIAVLLSGVITIALFGGLRALIDVRNEAERRWRCPGRSCAASAGRDRRREAREGRAREASNAL